MPLMRAAAPPSGSEAPNGRRDTSEPDVTRAKLPPSSSAAPPDVTTNCPRRTTSVAEKWSVSRPSPLPSEAVLLFVVELYVVP